MKTLLIRLILAASLAASFVPASAFADFSAKDRAELEKTHANATMPAIQDPAHVDWARFVAAHYAEDAKLLPPNAPMISGSAGILAFFQSLPPVSVFKPTDDEIVGDGNVAFIRGTYVITFNPPNAAPVTEKGKYVECWQRRRRIWRCVADIFNADEAMK